MANKQILNELALFAGAGGGILGGCLLGWKTICAVEIDAYCAGILVQRQNDGILPPFPIWDDVRTFSGNPWRGIVDVVSGGFPCQDISAAGKGAGIDGERSGLWREMARIIGEVRPRFAFVENSSMLTSRGLGRVLGDLAEMGYNARWGVVSAENSGAPHKRERIWLLGYSYDYGQPTSEIGESFNSRIHSFASRPFEACEFKGPSEQHENVADSNGTGCKEQQNTVTAEKKFGTIERCGWWKTEPDVGRMVDGVAFGVDRLKAIGNGQVPAVAKLAWEILSDGLV